MDSSSNDETDQDSIESPQPHKKRKISSQKSKSISNSNNTSISISVPLKNKKKRRLAGINSINSSRNNKNKNKNKSRLRDKVEPWWIGQRIIVQIPAPKANKNKKTKAKIKSKSNFCKIGREATIRDYNPNTQLSHIWFETEDSHCENVDLLELEEWDIANAKPVHEQLPFVPHNEWIPPYWKMEQRVLVTFDGKYGNGSQFCAFVDGYDPISRRHHINYGETTEWLWATQERVEIYEGKCYGYIEEKLRKFRKNKDEIIAPPWNPVPYGLDETFEMRSKEIHTNRNKSNNKNMNSKPQSFSRNDQQKNSNSNSNVVAAQNKNDAEMNIDASVKIFGNKTHPRRKLHGVAVPNGKKQKKNSVIRKTRSTLDKLLKSTKQKRNTITTQRHFRRHSSAAQKKEKKHCDDILENNNESVTLMSCSSSSCSSSESTFDTKTCQKMSDSDDDIMSSSKANTNTKIKHIKHSKTKRKNKTANNGKNDIDYNPKLTNITTKKQSKKKKISLKLSLKNKNKQQTQTMPIHLPINQPIIVHQIPATATPNQLQLQTMSHIPLPMRSVIPIPTTMQLFMPHVVTNNLTISQAKHPPLPLIQRKKKKYPRKAIIGSQTWIRHYSRNDRKYYWLLHNDQNVIVGKEWDPWRKNGEKAPWMVCMQKWGKFTDPSQKKEYYYNYETQESTFKRPKGFEADEQIQYDSADDHTDHTPKW